MSSRSCRVSALQRIREEARADAAQSRRWDLLAETETFMIVPPRFAEYPGCEDAIWHTVQQAMLGQCSAADALGRASAEIDAIVRARAGLSEPG